MPKASVREQKGDIAIFSPTSTGGMLIAVGLFCFALAAVNLANGPGRYGVGPNVIIPEAEREAHFRTFSLLCLTVNAVLVGLGAGVAFRQKWAIYAAFPVLGVLCLLRMFASFEGRQELFLFVALAVIVMVGFFLFGTLNWLKLHKSEAQFQTALDADEDEITTLIRLLGSNTSSERVRALEEIADIGPEAAPAVDAVIASLQRGIPPGPDQKNACGICSKPLSVWTKDKVKTPSHPGGVPCCIACRDRLVAGRPGEAQRAAEALAAIGKPAKAALPTLQQVAKSPDANLVKSCKDAVRAITTR